MQCSCHWHVFQCLHTSGVGQGGQVEVDLYSTTALEMILADCCYNSCRILEEGDSCRIRICQPLVLVVATATLTPPRALICK